EAALAREMPLLKGMGVNVIRQYVGVPPRWVKFIYERYGIYTVVNHPCARYGFTLDGVWIPQVSIDYSDPRLREAVKAEVVALVDEFRGTPGMLMWLLGNENNYGLSWASSEIEALPEGERNAARARYLYSMFGEITRAIKARDDRPVAMANGDLQYIDIIAEECKDLDVLGCNVYRGISARDLFEVVKYKLGIPVMFTEFGADAWNAKEMREDQETQCRYLLGQWREIYEQSSGKGRVGNAIGGFIFQWTDGWWKFRQEERLDIHDTNASWPNAGYPEDYVEGDNNMNEEWWGITAKGPSDSNGLYHVYPRASYYALQEAFRLDPYAAGTDLAAIARHFDTIEPAPATLLARGDRAALLADVSSRVRVTGLRLEFETYHTGGSNINTPDASPQGPTSFPAFRGFDQMQSFYADLQAQPSENVTGTISLSFLGSVPLNPIDEIFYENRGRPVSLGDEGLQLEDIERLKVYRAGISWDDRWFMLDGFYRTGHFHWGYEGDFFGLYREAFYGENIDIYNGEAPVGVEISGKKWFEGLKFAIGPELWWGANPGFLAKYARNVGPITATAIYQEDLEEQTATIASFAVPVPPTRKATLHLSGSRGPVGLEVGGIWGGNTKVGDRFNLVEERNSVPVVLQDDVRDEDTFGAKAKVTLEKGRWHWYAQGAYMGIVADAGPTATITYTGWHLKDSGSGNQSNVISGLAVNLGNVQLAPNVLYQKPLVGPGPGVNNPVRNVAVAGDPFAVRANREMFGAEFLVTYDPTPATWMWAWDNIVREDAKIAVAAGIVYRDFPTTQDGGTFISAEGNAFPFPAATPPRDLWEAHARIVSSPRSNLRVVANLFVGQGEPNGDDQRRIERYGGDARIAWGSVALETFAKFNDWGAYDYHRDFNLTFPKQLMGDLSYTLGAPRWFGFPQTRFGVRATWRSLDRFSPRYCPALVPDVSGNLTCDPTAPGEDGTEWEIRSYLHFAM
ncbi:MAG: glycosidase, partial [Candidatus Krumholzibacteria bacterium]|nr:glycosidase [Candidatus Krumholzibacteria bacterium]